MIDRFGVQAIMNRSYLGFGEVNRILAAERIEKLERQKNQYTDDQGKVNWAAWAKDDPQGAEFLSEAMKAAEDEGLLKDG